MKKYYRLPIKKAVTVKNLITIEYLEMSDTFSYPEETHNFCEIAYVDNGSMECALSESRVLLGQGDLFTILPGTIHSYSTSENATVFVLCFECVGTFLELIAGKTPLGSEEKKLVSRIVREAKSCFKFPFRKKLSFLENPDFASLQMVENHIENLLVSLIRSKLRSSPDIKFVLGSEELEDNIVRDIKKLLLSRIFGNVTLDEICKNVYYSKTYVNTLMKKNTGYTVKQYYNLLKINEAKELLKQGLSVAAISDKLCFESPNYFSKVFIRYTGTTPSKFKNTVL